jgi:hypothetical protein
MTHARTEASFGMILINAAQPAALFGLSRRCDSLTTPPEHTYLRRKTAHTVVTQRHV